MLVLIGGAPWFIASRCDFSPVPSAAQTPARRIAESVTVTGFVRTAVIDMPYNYDDVTFAEAYFIGPAPAPDPLAVVTVPTIDLAAITPPIVAPAIGNAVVARGKRPDQCAASVSYLNPPVSDPAEPGWNLTPEQLDRIRTGAETFVVVHVYNCLQSSRS
ncbi:hypothetical protein ACQP06_27885 [Nocardia sp. CA-136227]|uniref:hypothetical protein n=1 Tax=Nocardia sp. CA-136227 TaxID=3239979 RepID=UPI003D960E72